MSCQKLTYRSEAEILAYQRDSENSTSLKAVYNNLKMSEKGRIDCCRYGYQGSEKDDEVKGGGNSYTTLYRLLDPRVGRWLSIDPKSDDLPFQSPFCSMDNNPIKNNDPEGDIVPIVVVGVIKAEAWGFGIAFGTDAVIQTAEIALSDDKTMDDYSLKRSLISGAFGAVSGGTASSLKNSASLANTLNNVSKTKQMLTVAAIDGTLGASQSASHQIATGEGVSPMQIMKDGFTAVLTGQIANNVSSNAINKGQQNSQTKMINRQADRADRMITPNVTNRNSRVVEQKRASTAKVTNDVKINNKGVLKGQAVASGVLGPAQTFLNVVNQTKSKPQSNSTSASSKPKNSTQATSARKR